MSTHLEALNRLREQLKQSYASDVRFANRSVIQGTGNPGRYGRSLFANGVKHELDPISWTV